jgi:outer membrane protein TolC
MAGKAGAVICGVHLSRCSKVVGLIVWSGVLLGGELPAQAPATGTRETPAAARSVTPLPALSPTPAGNEPGPLPGATNAPPPIAPRRVPINLDTVFRLAQEQNVPLRLAREKLQEALAARDLAARIWLPDILIGPSYYRHEGGIANEDGTLTHSSFSSLFAGLELNSRLDLREATYRKVEAERQLWQQKGEVRRLTSQTVLEAAQTYVDLLAAYAALALAQEIQRDLEQLDVYARKRAATLPAARIESASVAAQLAAQQQLRRKGQASARTASAKLVYLLSLDPCTELVPTDPRLVPYFFVAAERPCEELVAQAQTHGPGIQEMEGLLCQIQQALEQARGLGRFLPAVELRLAEGAFATGPGDSLTWDNRLDLGLHARWNLSERFTARDRQRLAQARYNQAQLSFQDLRARLALGVAEARETSLSAQEIMHQAQEQIRQTHTAYQTSRKRLEENLPGASVSESLLLLEALSTARLNYLQAVREHNRAQLQLLMLLGGASEETPAVALPADASH